MKRSYRVVAVSFLILILLGVYVFVEPYLLKVNRVTFADEDVPDSFVGKKIVFVSDIHHGPFFSIERVGDLVDEINALEPDLVLMGGDYVYKDPEYIAPVFQEFSRLKAPLGVFGVLGNHDHWEGASAARIEMAAAGITNLDNRAVWVTEGEGKIKIGGVGDVWEDVQIISPTIEDVNNSDFVILLSHNPEYAEEITTDKVDYMLSGHTHGGQVTVFGLYAPALDDLAPKTKQKYRSGLVETIHTKVFVTKGVGTIGYPIRFFARPEITLITLTKN
ncbi:MAG: metallophosphoesterase [Candidatus Altiarchaeota archaeon]